MISKLYAIKDKIPSCKAPIWAQSGHAQTILGHLLKSPKIPKGEAFTVELEDGEMIRGSYHRGTRDVLVYLFHGLGGNSEAAYMQRTSLISLELGYHVVLMNHRGCGDGGRLAKNPYHSGRYKDLSATVEKGRSLFPTFKHLMVGFSLSGNALLCLAGVPDDIAKPDFAISVNAPVHLDKASLLLNKGLNRIYSLRFLRDLRSHININDPENIHLIKNVKDLRTFDQHYTAPRGGFTSNLDYYEKSSAKQYLNSINIPTVMISAKDDPFVDYLDYEEAEKSDSAILHLEDIGGHMGYLSLGQGNYYRWLDLALSKYLEVFSVN